jgi:hypothetical protein
MSAHISDPVTAAAMRDVTLHTDPTGNGVTLADPRDRKTLLEVLNLLRAGGY